jgi:hypothetical protein
MIMETFGHGVTQIDQYNKKHQMQCVCSACGDCSCPSCPSSNSDCDRRSWPNFRAHGFEATPSDVPLPWDTLKHQLSDRPCCKGKPIAIAMDDTTRGVHMTVAYGFTETDAGGYLSIHDPWPHCLGGSERSMSYDDYRGLNGMNHVRDYYDVKYTGNFDTSTQAHAYSVARPRSFARLVAISSAALLGPAHDTAQAGLATLRQLAERGNYQALGFKHKDEISYQLTLGVGLRDTVVSFDGLVGFVGGDPKALLIATQRVVFPVLAGGQLRSSVTVVLTNGVWKASSFGMPNVIEAYASQRQLVAQQKNIPLEAFSIVRVPALSVHFVSYESAGTVWFIPIYDDARFRFTRGTPITAAVALQRMVRRAQLTNPDLPG